MKKILYTLLTIATINAHEALSNFEWSHAQTLSFSEERIIKAEQAYENEVKWATPFRIAAGAVTFAAVAYLLYHYTRKPTPVITQDTWRYFENMSPEEQKAFMQKAGALFEQAKPVTEKPKEKTWPELALNAATLVRDGSWWMVSSLTYQIAVLGIMGFGGSLFSSITRAIPTKGSLSWYIAARTNYAALANLLFPQERIHARTALPFLNDPFLAVNGGMNGLVSAEEMTPVLQLFILEVEKIIGYLRYTGTHLELQTPFAGHIKGLCQSYAASITTIVNELVEQCNYKSATKETVGQTINRIASEIQRATILMDTFN